MSILKNFHYSQSSLQDFKDCNRRFYLRYIKKIKWPAVQSEPIQENENYIVDGTALHEFIYQYLIGIPDDKIINTIFSSRVNIWWDNFLSLIKNDSSFANDRFLRLPEFTLVGMIGGYKLIAKYDLLVIQPDGIVFIYDWKTSQKKPKREWLTNRIQTKIYPALFLLSGQHLIRNEINPDDVTMNYWFANQSGQVESIEYSESKFNQDLNDLKDLITAIDQSAMSQTEIDFPVTEDTHKCGFCVYRSLCGTGVQAGSLDDYQDDTIEEISIDFDQINEVHF